MLTLGPPRVVVTHWAHPEVAGYLASFSDPVLPAAPGQVFPPATVADLAAGAAGLITGMSDRVDEAFLAGCPRPDHAVNEPARSRRGP